MRKLWNILLKGLAALLPIGVTIYLIYWLAISTENMLGNLIKRLVGAEHYWPGMGLIVGLIVLFITGLVVNAWLLRQLFQFGERLMAKIPFVKSVYGALKDFLDYLTASRQGRQLQKVVVVNMGPGRLLGFLTREGVDAILTSADEEEMVAVYFPMSYQIGGYTLYIARSRVTPIDMSVEDAMRMALTAGLSSTTVEKG